MYSFSLTRGAQCAHKSLTSRRGMHSLLPHLALPSFPSLCFLSHGQPPHLPPTFLDCYPTISAHPSSIADPLLANSSNGGDISSSNGGSSLHRCSEDHRKGRYVPWQQNSRKGRLLHYSSNLLCELMRKFLIFAQIL